MTRKIAMMLLILTMSLFVGSTIMNTEVYASSKSSSSLFGDDLDVGNDGSVTTNKDTENGFASIIAKYKNFIAFFSGIGAITMVAVFIFHFIKLGSTATNPGERSKVTTGLIWSGLAAAGLGSVTLIVSIFYNVL